jgi:CRISPR-associated endonuclease Csn1
MDWQATDEATQKNPYCYRALAVEQKLDLNSAEDRYKIGRAFYHLTQRRGFLSNRLEGTKESDGAVKKSISEINTLKGEKTLGQYFYGKYQKGEKIRNVYTHREEHYLDEFNRICEFQKLDSQFVAKLKKAIFYQRPLKSQKGLVGKCVFEPNKPRCSVSRPEFEEYRMLCFVNSIKIKTPGDDRKSKDYFDFEDLAKQLAPKQQYKYYKSRDIYPEDWLFNYSMKTTVSGCPVSARFKDLFGDNFMDLKLPYKREKDGKESVIDIHDVWHVLFSFDSDEKLKEFAEKRLLLTGEQVSDFLKIRLKKDYASLSLKAINKILPFLRAGLLYSHAVFLANMEEAIPDVIWKKEENRTIIKEEIEKIIANHQDEKQICEIVNGIIKNSHKDESAWSEEASELFKKDLFNKIKAYFGERTYNSFTEEKKNQIETDAFELLKKQMKKNGGRGEFISIQRIEEKVKSFLTDNFEVEGKSLKKIYHPSAIDVYKPPIRKDDGKLYLGSPMVSSIRNPMAMRALHQLRKVINELIKKEIIDSETRIHIEMARGLMNANERKAYQNWQRDRENQRKAYAQKIKEHFSSDKEPSETDILKYQLWEEQNHKCIYTGREIALNEFLGANPSFDIEHTIPRSVSLDNSQENKTLCENEFNRKIKRNRIPFELANHTEILTRIEHWKEKYEDLNKQINKTDFLVKRNSDNKDLKDNFIRKRHELRFQRDYWQNKYRRFTMKDVPEGFKNSQLVDTGIITKYSRLYLNTLFDKVYTVKGSTIADFRRLWGLQDEYEKKARVNHIHHCIDAITIACITKEAYENLAQAYHKWEEVDRMKMSDMPRVNPPWSSFVPDLKSIENEVFISHYTPDVLPKQTKKKLRERGRIIKNKNGSPVYQQGDTVRGSLHQQTFYGAVERTEVNKKGELEKIIKYVVRKPLDLLDDNGIKNIVDEQVRNIVEHARTEEKKLKKEIEVQRKKFARAEEEEESYINAEIEKLNHQIKELYTMPNKNGDPVPIKKVRVYQPMVTNPLPDFKKHRDLSGKEYKQQYNVANDGNYAMAVYEGIDRNEKLKRSIIMVNNFDAGKFFNGKLEESPFPDKHPKNGLYLKYLLKTGTLVLFWEKSPEELRSKNVDKVQRLYKITKMNKDGRITFKYHQEARNDENLRLDYENEHGVKAPKSLTNGESFINFINPFPKLLLSPPNFNFIVENYDFKISSTGKIKWLDVY